MSTGILMVDDDLEDQFIFRNAIEMIRSTQPVHSEENGVNALEYLNSLPPGKLPCIIIADLNMPQMNGTDLLDSLKRSETLKHIPVVVYSTSENKLEQESCVRRGAYLYISKPLNYKQNIEIAKKIVEICLKVNGEQANENS